MRKVIRLGDKEVAKIVGYMKQVKQGVYVGYLIPCLMFFAVGLTIGLGDWNAGKLIACGLGMLLVIAMTVYDARATASACVNFSVEVAKTVAVGLFMSKTGANASGKPKTPRNGSKSVKRQKNV